MLTTWLSRRRAIVVILAGAALVRVGAYLLWQPVFAITADGDVHGSGAYDLYARNLISTGIYGLTPGAPDAVLPPLFSAALAAVYRIAGRAGLSVVLFNTVADMVTILAVHRIGLRLFPHGAAVGTLAAGCVAFYPYLVFQSLTVIDTPLFLALLYAGLALTVALRDARTTGRRWAIGIACGVLAALATLTRPVLPFLFLAAAAWLIMSVGIRGAVVRLVPVVLAGALALTPWLARNTRVAGAVVMTTNAGSNFWQGNNEHTVRYLRAGYDVQWIPSAPTGADDPLGYEADRVLFGRALDYLAQHPRDIPALLWTKFLVHWSIDVAPRMNPAVGGTTAAGGIAAAATAADGLRLTGLEPDDPIAAYSQPLFDRRGRGLHRISWSILLVAGLIGLAMTFRHWRAVWLVWAVPVAIMLVSVLFHPSTRYRAPADPAWFLLAAVALRGGVGILDRRRALAVTADLPPGTRAARPAIVCAWIGTARYARPLAPGTARKWRALAGLGLRMHVIGFSTGPTFTRFSEEATFHLLPAYRAAPLRHLTMLIAGPCALAWIVLRHRVDVVFAQSPLEAAPAAVLLTCLRRLGRKVPLVVESHGDFERSIFLQRRMRGARLYRRLMHAAATFALRRADRGRAVSRATRTQMLALAPHLSVAVFPTWVDADCFTFGERDRPPSTSRMILFAGALIPRKGVHLLVEAFAEVAATTDAMLVIAGPDDNPDYALTLREHVRRKDLGGRVRFAGSVSPDAMRALMDEARALVLPSLSEGLARVLLEAMLRGTPVVATRVDGAPDVVIDGETGYLVDPDDSRVLADALRRVLLQPDVDRMGARARTRALQIASADAYVDGHRQLLRGLGFGLPSITGEPAADPAGRPRG